MGSGISGDEIHNEEGFIWRLYRPLPESHAVLWTVVITASIFDIVTTIVGLANRLEEGNAVARAFIATYGTPGIGLLKFSALVLLVVAWTILLNDRHATQVLAAFAVISLLTVALNAMTLATI